MKFACVDYERKARTGCVSGDRLILLPAVFGDVLDIIEGGPDALAVAARLSADKAARPPGAPVRRAGLRSKATQVHRPAGPGPTMRVRSRIVPTAIALDHIVRLLRTPGPLRVLEGH